MPANTTHGFPYPLPTEPVAQGAANMQALAESVERLTHFRIFDSVLAGVTFPVAAITLPTIPQTFRNLRLVCMLLSDQTTPSGVFIAFNGDETAADYMYGQVYGGLGTTVANGGAASQRQSGLVAAQNSVPGGPGVLEVPDYAGASGPRRFWLASSGYYSGSGAVRSITTGLWTPAAGSIAVTSIKLAPQVGLFAAGSRIQLYGEA